MDSRPVKIWVDSAAETLHALRAGSQVSWGQAYRDGYLTINYSYGEGTVGVRILGFHRISSQDWAKDPHRDLIPLDILSALDSWWAINWILTE